MITDTSHQLFDPSSFTAAVTAAVNAALLTGERNRKTTTTKLYVQEDAAISGHMDMSRNVATNPTCLQTANKKIKVPRTTPPRTTKRGSQQSLQMNYVY